MAIKNGTLEIDHPGLLRWRDARTNGPAAENFPLSILRGAMRAGVPLSDLMDCGPQLHGFAAILESSDAAIARMLERALQAMVFDPDRLAGTVPCMYCDDEVPTIDAHPSDRGATCETCFGDQPRN